MIDQIIAFNKTFVEQKGYEVLVLARKSSPKIIREDRICEML